MTLTHIRSSAELHDGLSRLRHHRIEQDGPRGCTAVLDESLDRGGELNGLFELRERNLPLVCDALGEQSRRSTFRQTGPFAWFQVAVSNGEVPTFEEPPSKHVLTLKSRRGAHPAWLCDELDRDRR